jgi:very-short-patch-repair endonuclease
VVSRRASRPPDSPRGADHCLEAELPGVSVSLEGCLYFIDIAFPHLKLAIEIDGRLHEEDEDLFESDRWRQNALVADGWRVLRFTWRMLKEHPEIVVAAILHACSQKVTLL